MDFQNFDPIRGEEREINEDSPVDDNGVPLESMEAEQIATTTGDDLRARRDSLLCTFDRSWPEIAWKVQNLARIEEVPPAFRRCPFQGAEYVVDLLRTKLAPSAWAEAEACIGRLDTECAAEKLRNMRAHLTELNSQIVNASLQFERLRSLLERVKGQIPLSLSGEERTSVNDLLNNPSMRSERDRVSTALRHLDSAAQTQQISTPNEDLVDSAHALAESFDQLQEQQESRSRERDGVMNSLRYAEVYFTQREALHLRQDNRYKTLTPRIVANAMVCVPQTGYRQSVDKCAKLRNMTFAAVRKTSSGMGLEFEFQSRAEGQQVKILRRIEQLVKDYRIQFGKSKSQQLLEQFVDNWVDLLNGDSPAVTSLKANKPLIVRSVLRVEKRSLSRPEAVPYAVARLFSYLLRTRSLETKLIAEVKEFLLEIRKDHLNASQ